MALPHKRTQRLDRLARILKAARVPETVQPQEFGMWKIERKVWKTPTQVAACGFGSQTILRLATLATLHTDGEIVMEDSLPELMRHLPAWVHARGRVLVTGLGLGCVVRGLLAVEAVEHVDVVEICPWIIRVIGPTVAGDRVTIHHADARAWEPPEGARFDLAWHDIHCMSDGDPALQVMHAGLMVRYIDRARRQGAWQFPREAKRRIRRGAGALMLVG